MSIYSIQQIVALLHKLNQIRLLEILKKILNLKNNSFNQEATENFVNEYYMQPTLIKYDFVSVNTHTHTYINWHTERQFCWSIQMGIKTKWTLVLNWLLKNAIIWCVKAHHQTLLWAFSDNLDLAKRWHWIFCPKMHSLTLSIYAHM